MRKHLARILVFISIFTVFFALSVNAKEVESEYSKGITILDDIPTSITFGDEAPKPRIKINGVTYEAGTTYSCKYSFDSMWYSDYTQPFKTGTCYVAIDVSSRLDLWEYLCGQNGESFSLSGHSFGKIASFEVKNVDISVCTADPIADVVFDPVHGPVYGMNADEVKLYFKGRLLTWQERKLEYSNNKKAGTATVTCLPYDSMPFKGQKKLTFKILPFEFDDTTEFSNVKDQTYTGNPVTTTFTLYATDGVWSGLSDEDYTATYSNNVNVGTATIKVTGKGSYKGTVSTTFNITPEQINKATATLSDQVYTGSELKPAPVVKFNGKTLTAGTDYKIRSYGSNINAGTGAYVILDGLNNFEGYKIIDFKILKADISKASFNYTPVVYKRPIKWEGFTVKYKSKTLTKGTDFDAEIQSTNTLSNGLEVVWKITGKNNFQGETTVTQTLLPMALSDIIGSASVGNYTYTGSSIKPTSIHFQSNDVYSLSLTENVDYKLSYGKNTNAGQGTITLTGIGKYTGTYTINFTINPKYIYSSDVEIADIEDQIYTGSPITPDISAVYNGKALVKDKDYTLSYSKNTAAGTATVTITGKGNFTGSTQIRFKIVEVHDISVSDIPNMVVDYGERPTPIPEVTVDGKKGVRGTDFTISWDYSKAPACKANVRIKVTGETITRPFALKYDINSVKVSDIGDMTATGSAIEPEITVKAGSIVLMEGTHYTLSFADNVNEGTATVTITGINNFTGSREVVFNILAPTATPTATPTEVPEETATPVPTEGPTGTPEATATPAPVISATVTPAASTVSVTPTPSPTVAEVTPSPSSSEVGTGSDDVTPSAPTAAPADVKTAVIKGNTYKITGKKTAALLKASKKAKKLTIPATVKIKGKKYKVTAILNKAAVNNKKLQKIVIGKNVRKIGKQAFAGCKKVKTIQFKTKKITSVKKNAFKGISSKTKFVFKGNAGKIKKLIRKSGYKNI